MMMMIAKVSDFPFLKITISKDLIVMIIQVVDIGIDLTEFYQSVEWDILSVPAQRCDHNGDAVDFL